MAPDAPLPPRTDLGPDTRAESIGALVDLLEALRDPRAINSGLAELVSAHALVLLHPSGTVHGSALDGRVTAIDGPSVGPVLSRRLGPL
ncbi:hypothetical protein EV639_10840 [Rathayibacter tanaceti]|uniref:Uncharacterized protein n=2 Tax=Rathayibacter tanaceti TaxID=1671680 RepID=A0AAE6V7K7_9MICO|nr:hypothetical protein [Rathayibacter tanaceti]QHC56674.1 hypothetical protein GSU10_14260 [Rathayibacter tanaceti]TCO36175.1 hypothetical protein EV639_10840 [Rathayibacter tanaceti]